MQTNPNEVRYCDFLGAQLIKEISFDIGGEVAARYRNIFFTENGKRIYLGLHRTDGPFDYTAALSDDTRMRLHMRYGAIGPKDDIDELTWKNIHGL